MSARRENYDLHFNLVGSSWNDFLLVRQYPSCAWEPESEPRHAKEAHSSVIEAICGDRVHPECISFSCWRKGNTGNEIGKEITRTGIVAWRSGEAR